MKVMCIKEVINDGILEDINFGEICTVLKEMDTPYGNSYVIEEHFYGKPGPPYRAGYFSRNFVPLSDVDENELFMKRLKPEFA